jgi:hypothetical protein
MQMVPSVLRRASFRQDDETDPSTFAASAVPKLNLHRAL